MAGKGGGSAPEGSACSFPRRLPSSFLFPALGRDGVGTLLVLCRPSTILSGATGSVGSIFRVMPNRLCILDYRPMEVEKDVGKGVSVLGVGHCLALCEQNA